MANDSRGSRLLSDLNNAFKRDPEIDEYDFLPVLEPKHNRSPLILQEHKLGLEMWSVKILYQYAYSTLLAWRHKQTPTKFLDPKTLICLSRSVVLVNPECYTAWNVRKELVESGDLSIVDDLKLGALVLTKNPKSPETFSHRKWLLQKYMDCYLMSSHGSNHSNGSNSLYEEFVNMDAIDVNVDVLGAENGQFLDAGLPLVPDHHECIQKEFSVCQKAAEKYQCNYNAWSHRIWVVENCYNCSIQIIFSELHSTENWVSRNISDHSGFHYRQFLLTNLYKQADVLKEQLSISYRNLIQKELQFIIDLIKRYNGHEALWYHRRYVFQAMGKSCDLTTVAIETISPDGNLESPLQNNLKKTKFENDCQVLLLREVDMVSKFDLISKDKYHKNLAQKYLDWIQKCCRR